MNTRFRTAFLLLPALLAGCPDTSGRDDYRPVSPGSPPAVSTADCLATDFAPTSDVDVLPGGVWLGTLADCGEGAAHEFVWAMTSEDGRFRILGPNEHLLAGTGGTEGNQFRGSGVDFAATGKEYYGGPTTSLFVEGLIDERRAFEGRWGTEWGSYGYFRFEYRQEDYERATSLDDLAGTWPVASSVKPQPPGDSEGVWTIEPDGSFVGQDVRGCLYSGQFTVIDERFSMLAVEFDVAACMLDGSWSGLGYIEDLVDWYETAISLSVDDGQRAVRIVLAIERP